jgi:hypothetical protein
VSKETRDHGGEVDQGGEESVLSLIALWPLVISQARSHFSFLIPKPCLKPASQSPGSERGSQCWEIYTLPSHPDNHL